MPNRGCGSCGRTGISALQPADDLWCHEIRELVRTRLVPVAIVSVPIAPDLFRRQPAIGLFAIHESSPKQLSELASPLHVAAVVWIEQLLTKRDVGNRNRHRFLFGQLTDFLDQRHLSWVEPFFLR